MGIFPTIKKEIEFYENNDKYDKYQCLINISDYIKTYNDFFENKETELSINNEYTNIKHYSGSEAAKMMLRNCEGVD